jgi:hypothetical protein
MHTIPVWGCRKRNSALCGGYSECALNSIGMRRSRLALGLRANSDGGRRNAKRLTRLPTRLGGAGFVSPPIHEAFAAGSAHHHGGTLRILYARG